MLIPSAQPPHKQRQDDMAAATDRLTMCRMATEGDLLFAVNDLELRREGPSYTYDTVMALRAQGHREVCWIIGADMLLILPKWHKATELMRIARFLVMARPGCQIEWEQLPEAFQSLRDNVLPTPLLDISATEIRRRVRAGEPIEHLVPAGVARYIREKGLYKTIESK
jgi:nicotinate-nucleotide adenylyltransferase